MIPKDIVKFDCSGRPISQISSHFFEEFHSLTDLVMTNTHVTMISSDTFVGLNALQFLDLSNNPINRIESASFDQLISLKQLYLDNIAMRSIPPELINNLFELEFWVKPDGVKVFPGHHEFTTVTGALRSSQFLLGFSGKKISSILPAQRIFPTLVVQYKIKCNLSFC